MGQRATRQADQGPLSSPCRRCYAARMQIALPDFALVVLIGPSGAGKSSFARKHFIETEIVSSDRCRALICDDETRLDVTRDAFALLRHTAALRLKRRTLTVIDATSAKRADRAHLLSLAKEYHAPAVALVLDIDPAICAARNENRPLRDFGADVPQGHSQALRSGLDALEKDGFRQVHTLRTPEEVDAVTITREPLAIDRRADHGPFDIISDVHGCYEELIALLDRLGYVCDPYTEGEAPMSARHPQGRIAFFVGDLCDRGPCNVDVLRLVRGMCAEESARCVIGNHDFKLLRWLRKGKATLTHGLAVTVEEMEGRSDAFRRAVRDFIESLLSHQWLAGGDLVIAHAGLPEAMHGRDSGVVKDFAMFGLKSGEKDEYGLPVRIDWAQDYRGTAVVVHGHTPMPEAEWLNNVLCLDTGCVFGGKLTAFRWPEREMVAIPAARQYAEPSRPLAAGARTVQPE